MQRMQLCLASAEDLLKVQEAMRTVQLMMPRIELHSLVDADGKTVHFTCDSMDSLTLSSAVIMLKTMLGTMGHVKVS